MVRQHIMESYTRKEPCKYSLSCCDWLNQLLSSRMGFVPPGLSGCMLTPSLPLHALLFVRVSFAFQVMNIWTEYLNFVPTTVQEVVTLLLVSVQGFSLCFILLSLSTRSTLFDFTVSVFFLWLSERGKTLVQKKPTMYPEWKSTFDAHIYEGRVIQIVLMKAAEEPLSEVTVGVSVLAERCKKGNGKAEFWVRKEINSCNLLTWLCFFQAEWMPSAF